ncbi:MAG: hypothetical protein ACLFUS_12995 [Candidatus Sumerlaeia bacterium]
MVADKPLPTGLNGKHGFSVFVFDPLKIADGKIFRTAEEVGLGIEAEILLEMIIDAKAPRAENGGNCDKQGRQVYEQKPPDSGGKEFFSRGFYHEWLFVLLCERNASFRNRLISEALSRILAWCSTFQIIPQCFLSDK